MKGNINPYFALIIRPFRNVQTAIMLLLVSVSGSGLLLFLFVNDAYYEKFVEQMRGVYPEMFWQGDLLSDIDDNAMVFNIEIKKEIFTQDCEIPFYLGADDEPASIASGIRAVDLKDVKIDKSLKHIIKTGSNNRAVWMSASLYRNLFSVEYRKYAHSHIYLRDRIGRIQKFEIAGIFTLLNKEKWLILNLAQVDDLDLMCFDWTVSSIYRNDVNVRLDGGAIGRLAPNHILFNWYDRLPLYYRCLWDVGKNGYLIFGFCMLVLVFVYVLNIYQSIKAELKNNLLLLRLYGASKIKTIGVILSAWWAVLFTIITLSLFIVQQVVDILESNELFITSNDLQLFMVSLYLKLNGQPAAIGIFLFICLAPGLLMVFELKKKNFMLAWR